MTTWVHPAQLREQHSMNVLLRRLAACIVIPAACLASWVNAATPTALSFTPINAVPPNVQSGAARPLVMLNMSKDHQLFYRAYNEFSDYNGDGSPDGTYLHTVRYSGYFDSTKCYTYSNANRRFSPSGSVSSANLCSSAWHGNFLNWATMTRIDVLRKVLYGGTRSTDSATSTILERASLPMDAHSFAKYYANAGAATADRPDIHTITPFASTETELTFCNTTLGDNNAVSHTNTNPPLLRAARGNFSLWNAHERRQCRWSEENIWDADGGGNGNDPAISGFAASGNYPSRDSRALGGGDNGDFTVRVEVCNAAFLGSERCRQYPDGNYKPIGLLQEYGENDEAEFGLMTGSFSNNISGGVLRKNATSFRNEVNYLTNGTFVSGVNGIVGSIDRLKVYGFRYSDATYAANDNASSGNQFCAYQTIGLNNDQCASWGNPLGEMFIETLRYLGGKTPSSSYGSNADAKGVLMGLTVATWVDPLGDRGDSHRSTFGEPHCRPINNINFNASVISYDRDTTAPFSDLNPAQTLENYTNQIGTGEGIAGTSRFIGRTATVSNSACTAKTLGNLWDAEGLCPSAPAYRGSFSLAGAAYWANTNPIRTVPSGTTGLDANRAFRVRSYGVALAPGVPRITVRTSGTTPLTAVIQPSYRLSLPSGAGSGTLVDFRVISQTATAGRYLVVWEDSEQGGDYDNDVLGILEWALSGTTLTVTTRTLSDPTFNPQGFGYTISGTNRDGEHFHSGILGFNYTDATNLPVTQIDGSAHPNINASGGCTNCQRNQPPSRATYTVTGNAGGVLEDPMWYAAKWGGFRNSDNYATGSPTSDTTLWDAVNNSTGALGSDGVPDTYSLVFNPEQLEASLRRVFQSGVFASNAAPSVSSSQLISSSLKYVANFNPLRQNGDVLAFELDGIGDFKTTPLWSAGEKLTAASATATSVGTRRIISNDQGVGFPFTWSNVSSTDRASYLTLLRNGTSITAAQAERVLRFVRGDRGVSGVAGLRVFDETNIMGPVVSASPWLQDRPVARFLDSDNPGYSSFVATHRNRTRILWVGAGDGMLHAFDAGTGAPVMSYVPETLVPRLSALSTNPGVQAMVDGSPFTADVDLNAGVSTTRDWRTYAFGTLGRGGRGLYALDATDVTTLAAAETGSNAASIFRWQFTANDDADLGHVLSDIDLEPGTGQASLVVKLQDGRFALVFGNGYGSSTGKAALFVLPVQGPNGGSWSGRYHKIVLDSGTGNGLSTPTMLDTNNDGRVDTVYAGDLKGNLWKVDLSSATPSNWSSSYLSGTTPTPLYVATTTDGSTRLPITGAPQFSFPSFGGTIVTFATGLAVAPGDFPKSSVTQRVYGIWDRPTFATAGRSLPRGTATLVERSLSRTAGGQVVATSTPPIDYNNATPASAKDGWFFNLPSSSEMVVSNLGFRARSIFFTSIRPSAAAACSDTPLTTFYLLDPTVGFTNVAALGTVDVAGVATTVMGTEVDDQKVILVSDASGRKTSAGTGGTSVCPDGSAALRIVGQGTDESLCFRQSTARFQWREVPGLRTR
jgi:type IV pilus assembly protein PilY1